MIFDKNFNVTQCGKNNNHSSLKFQYPYTNERTFSINFGAIFFSNYRKSKNKLLVHSKHFGGEHMRISNAIIANLAMC